VYGFPPHLPACFESWSAAVHPDDLKRVEAELKRHIEQRAPRCTLEFRRVHPERGLRWLRSISQIVYEGDQPVRITGLTQDVTEARRLEADLRRSNEELEQFASVVAHDLRSPLLTINGCVELLARSGDVLSDESRQYLGYINQAISGMSQLIHSLLSFTHTGHGQILCSRCDMNMVLSRAAHQVRSQVEQSGALITSDVLPCVSGDGTMLSQLFQNLLENSIKYHGKAPPAIHVGARREGALCTFWVRDNGVGIDPSHLEHVFQPFRRVAGQQGTDRGLGLGLSTCRHIVERHGGRIWAESTPGQGTTFFFTVPSATEPEQATSSSGPC
jgi:signal transduction histidine kinase